MNCPKCGRENPSAARFCVFCGTALAAGTSSASPPASPAVPPPAPAYGTGPSPAAYPTAMPAYAPPPPFPPFLMELPSPWRERYAMAHALIRTGNLLRILGLALGGALSLFLMLPVIGLASEVSRQGGDATTMAIWLTLGVLSWGGAIAAGLFALGTLVRASGYQLAALLNLEVRNAPEESLPAEQKARILSAAARLGQA
jgi:hypothetical protein